jgi:hypothetical protein
MSNDMIGGGTGVREADLDELRGARIKRIESGDGYAVLHLTVGPFVGQRLFRLYVDDPTVYADEGAAPANLPSMDEDGEPEPGEYGYEEPALHEDE